MSIKLAVADPAVQKGVAVTALAFGGSTWWTAATEIALELFGVPLPVVLAAATGAFWALSFVSSTSYAKTLVAGVLWTLIGTYGSQLALSLLGAWAGVQIPTGALAGAAILVSACGPVLVTPDNVQKLRAAIGRRLDNIGRQP